MSPAVVVKFDYLLKRQSDPCKLLHVKDMRHSNVCFSDL